MQSLSVQDGPTTAFKQCVVKYLTAPLASAARNPDDLSAVGDLWLGASRLLLDLYVTNLPMDPAVRRILLGETMALRLALLEEEMAAIELGEIALKGVSDSERVRCVHARLQSFRDEAGSLGPTIDRASDPARLAVLFNEVHSFIHEALVDFKLDQLVKALRSDHPQSLTREAAFQLATATFMRRLSMNYDDLDDLVQPITLAVLFAKFGMRCLARAMQLRHSYASALISHVVSFPTVNAIEGVQRSSVGQADQVQVQVLVAAACTYEVGVGSDRRSSLPGLIPHLDRLYQTWSAIRSHEQREAQEAESLYRVKKTDTEVLPDDELEAIELAELFPHFGELEETESPRRSETAARNDPPTFSAEPIASFHRMVISVSGLDIAHNMHDGGLFKESALDLLASSFNIEAFGEDIDHTSLAFQTRHLKQWQAAAQTCTSHPNFYLSPNEPQIRKAYMILTRLQNRLDMLIAEWPEQMVLQHIRDRCDRIMSLSVRAPVALVLAALELLLQHTNDWESYANQENSLKSFQLEVSALIIEWRRLELSSWMRLLDDEAVQYVAKDTEWTLRLYGAFIHGRSSTEDSSLHVEAVLPMVTTYLNGSTLGLFASRLAILGCFERMARELSHSGITGNLHLAAIAAMLHNIRAKAQLFSDRIRESLQSQRAVLDRSIRDFVRLASWKDVSVFSLKASAQKSHRQLYTSIRKFRGVLQQPVNPLLSNLSSICPQDAPEASDSVHGLTFRQSLLRREAVEARNAAGEVPAAHLDRLGDTLERYRRVFNEIPMNAKLISGLQLDSMAVDVIETVASLTKTTPASLTKENAKVVKNIASRKRKAFADLLKILRASGFSQSVRADLLHLQQSVHWLAARPPLLVDQLPISFDISNTRKIESYHHRQSVLMIALRAAFKGHNPDIASHDLQRGIGFTESMVAVALGERDQ